VAIRQAIADRPPCTTDHAPLARLSRTILRKAPLQASVEFGESPGPAPPPLPRIGATAITAQTVAQVVQARAVAAGFGLRDLGGHSLKRGALTTGMDRGIHPAKLKRIGRHKSSDVLGEYLEFGDLFEGHPLSGVL
jgi:hypothetical protein